MRALAASLALACLCSAGAKEPRETLFLDGAWQCRVDSSAWTGVTVPGHPELAGLFPPAWGAPAARSMRFRREVTLPAEWKDHRVFLRFGGVSPNAEVRWNGALAGAHEGGYGAFEFEITPWARFGAPATLSVDVTTGGRDGSLDACDSWALSGIYRGVELIARPATYLSDWRWRTRVAPDTLAARVVVDGTVAGVGPLPAPLLRVRLRHGGRDVPGGWAETPLDATGTFRVYLEPAEPRLWNAEEPSLYDLRLEVLSGGRLVDAVEESVGLCCVTTDGGKLRVNGQPVVLRGVVRDNLFPAHGRAIPGETSRREVERMLSSGVNAVWPLGHPPEEAFLDWADRLGLYVVDTIPLSATPETVWDEAHKEAARRRVRETVARDRHHPCVIAWSLGDQPLEPAVLLPLYSELLRQDSSRPAMAPGLSTLGPFPEINSAVFPGSDLTKAARAHPHKPFLAAGLAHHGRDSGGGLTDAWNALRMQPNAAGAFVWQWADQGLLHPFQLGWPEHVEIDADRAEAKRLPSGLGVDADGSPNQVDLLWRGSAGEFTLRLACLAAGRIELLLDGAFAGRMDFPPGGGTRELPLAPARPGERRLSLLWIAGRPVPWDGIELLDARGRRAWRIGKFDRSHNEFAAPPRPGRLDPPQLDTRGPRGDGGVLDSDRGYGPAYAPFVAALAPLAMRSLARLDVDTYQWPVALENRFDFTALRNAPSEVRVQFFNEGRTWTQIWPGPPVSLPRGASDEVVLDLSFLRLVPLHPAAVEWRVLSSTGVDEAREVGRLSINLARPPRSAPAESPKNEVDEEKGRVELRMGDTELVFEEEAGGLVRYSRGRYDLIRGPARVGVWRPLLPHERAYWGGEPLLGEEYPAEVARVAGEMRVRREGETTVLTFANRYAVAASPELVLFDGTETYRVLPGGAFELSGQWTWQGPPMQLRRVGFDFPLAGELDELLWSGPGPANTWLDRRAGYLDGVHNLRRDAGAFFGNKTGVGWMTVFRRQPQGGISFVPSVPLDFAPAAEGDDLLLRVSPARGLGNATAPPPPEYRLATERGGSFACTVRVESF